MFVPGVVEGSPADKGGLEQGDVVIAFNGKQVETVAELRNLVAQTRPGQTATLKVIRNKKQMNVRVKIGDLEKLQQLARADKGNETLGVTVEKITPEIANKLGLKNTTGVVIARVASGSPADRSGLKAGDIVFRVGNQVVKDPEQFNKLVSELAESGKVMLLIRDVRTGRVGYIVVPVG